MAELRVRSTLDGSGFHGPLGAMRNAARGVLGGLQGQIAAAFSVGALTAFTSKVIELAGKFSDMADTLRINVEWMQKFLSTVRQTGGKEEDFRNFANRLMQSRQDAVNNPTGEAARGFQTLGISQNDVATQSAQGMMELIIKAFSNGADAKLSNALIDVGGKSAAKLVLAFEQGIDEQASIMSEDAIFALDEIGDRFEQLRTMLMSELAPAILAVVKASQSWSNQLRNQIRQGQTVFGEFFGSLAAGIGQFFSLIKQGKIKAAFEAIANAMEEGWSDASRAAVDMERDQNEQEDRAEANRDRARERRRQRDQSPLDLERQTPASKAKFGIQNDNLTSVGNFLGAGRSAIESIGQKTNEILVSHTSLLKSISENTKNKTKMDIQVPSS